MTWNDYKIGFSREECIQCGCDLRRSNQNYDDSGNLYCDDCYENTQDEEEDIYAEED